MERASAVPAVVPRLNCVVELGAKEMRYLCVTCGALRDHGDSCAVAPFGRQDCRWYRREFRVKRATDDH
jgi:hypothetical protein